MAAVDIGELRGIITLNDQFSGPVEKAADALGIANGAFSAAAQFAGIAAAGITAAAGAIVYLGDRGATVDDVRGSFAGFAAEAGSAADVMLGTLRSATDQTISDFDLMKMSTTAMGSGLIRSTEEMHTLAAGARLLADRTGGDTAEAFDMLTSSMASGRSTQLTQLGLFVDTEAAVRKYAESTGRSSADISKAEKAQIASNLTLAALRGELERSGEVQADFADRMAQGKVAVQNFVDNLALAIATSPVLSAGMGAVADAIMEAFGSNQQQQVETLMGFVNSFAIGLVQFAQVAVTAADYAVQGFYAIRAGFNTVLEFFYEGVTRAADLVADLASKGADLPGVGDAFAAVADGARGIADTAQAASLGFAALAVEAGASSNTASAAFETVHTALGNVRDTMEAAQGASAGLAAANEGTNQGLATLGQTAVATGDSYEELLERYAEVYNAMWELAQETANKEMELQQAITQANLTGTAAKLQQIEFERQAEITALQEKLVMYPEVYEELAALVNEKYRLMGDAARGHHADIVVQAGMAGFQSRAQMEETAAKALDTYTRMKDSGKFTYSELERAHKDYKDKEKALNEESAVSAMQQFELIANGAKTLLRALFGNSKAGAIATAIIDTAQAVVKALASAPPPINYGLAAAVGAAGLIQINKIRSTEASFEQGTGEGGRFVDFGRGTMAELHHKEAVVNTSGAVSIADVIVGEMDLREDRTASEIRALRADMRDRDRALPLALLSAARLVT